MEKTLEMKLNKWTFEDDLQTNQGGVIKDRIRFNSTAMANKTANKTNF